MTPAMRNGHGLVLHLIAIYVSFLLFGYFQEKISISSNGKPQLKHYAFLSLMQGAGGAMVGLAVLRRRRMQIGASPWLLLDYFKCSAIRLLSSQLGHRASEHINYPTLVVARSCKVIPVLGMNFLLYGRRYEATKYISAALLTAGVLLFLSRSDGASSLSALRRANGVFPLLLSMVCDGSVNSIQDNIFKLYGTDSFHMMLYLNAFSAGMSLAMAMFSKELLCAVAFLRETPSALIDLVCLSTLNLLGQLCVYSMLEKYGALTLTVSTVFRKMLSVLLSIAVFKHKMCAAQYIGLALVFLSFCAEMLCAHGRRQAAK